MTRTTTWPILSFPLYLVPSIPFRRRRSSMQSVSTSISTSSPSSSPPTHPSSFLPPSSTSYLRCHKCLTDLIPASSIISKGFTGRHGRAYLVAPPAASYGLLDVGLPAGDLPNTVTQKAVPRQLVTGAHTVSDIRCRNCDTVLGWKYVAAEEESQRYKVGKFILETRRVVKSVNWEREGDGGDMEEGFAEAGGEIEFDSEDEDECEDMFMGIWNPERARRARKNKIFRKDDEEDDDD